MSGGEFVGHNPIGAFAGPAQFGIAVGNFRNSKGSGCNAGHIGGEAHLVAPAALVGFAAVGTHLGGVRRCAGEAGEGVGAFCRIHGDEVLFVTVEANLPLGLSFSARDPGKVSRVAGHIGIGQVSGLGASGNLLYS